jgi:thymidylate kinase
VTRRLATDFRLPRLGSDTLGHTIKSSQGLHNGDHAYWIAYDVLFALAEEFMEAGVSVILDITMGWAFQWARVDAILARCPQTLFLPILLRCPFERCIERTRERFKANPDRYDPPDVYEMVPKNRDIWRFLTRLDSPEVRWIDADRLRDEVYTEVRAYIVARLGDNSL